jgi:hypothetical protein
MRKRHLTTSAAQMRRRSASAQNPRYGERGMALTRRVHITRHPGITEPARFAHRAPRIVFPSPSGSPDELARMRRVTQMVPRDAPDHLLHLAMQFRGLETDARTHPERPGGSAAQRRVPV